jgi:aryl-alcohol dehydrogenase-like predicted oxidoreductase
MPDLLSLNGVSLGLGLVSLGRRWGFRPGEPPSPDEGLGLLRHALARGVCFFDTAPAYGASETILGNFLREIGGRRDELTIATKMGEHWIEATSETRDDHSFAALRDSIDESLRRLGRIDIMQIHRATLDNIFSDDVLKAVDYCRSKGIETFGVSSSDVETTRAALGSDLYSVVQFPYSRTNTKFAPMFEAASRASKMVLVNRPFAMGELIPEDAAAKLNTMRNALSFIREQRFNGHILTGTRNPVHLDETVSAFAELSKHD